jgi:hypothetical protein
MKSVTTTSKFEGNFKVYLILCNRQCDCVSQTLLQYVNSQLSDTWTAAFKIEKTFYAVCATSVLSSGMLRRVVWYILTDVSEVIAAPIIRATNEQRLPKCVWQRICNPTPSECSRLISLTMEAVSTRQTSVNFYQTTRRSHLHTRRRESRGLHLDSCRAGVASQRSGD